MDGDPQPGHRAWRAGGADHGSHSRGGPGAETPGGRGSDGTKAGEAGVPLLAELGQGGEAGPARDEPGGEGAGRGWARAFGRALAAGADESAAGATGSDPGGAGRTGAGTSGLAAGRGAHAMGADSAVAGEGSWETGEAEKMCDGRYRRAGVFCIPTEALYSHFCRIIRSRRQWRSLNVA